MAEDDGQAGVGEENGAAVASTDEQIEIKFVIVPEGFSHIRKFATASSLQEVKEMVEQDLRIPVANMRMFFDGQGRLARAVMLYAPLIVLSRKR